MRSFVGYAIALAALAATASTHSQEALKVPEGADWMTRHMTEEHHITSFDAGVFFNLHDYDSTGKWSPDDVRKTLGLMDDSTARFPQQDKDAAVRSVFELYDTDRSGDITYPEFVVAHAKGVVIPDFGFGPGHHGDYETEYEIHHFEKYHSGDDVKLEDLTHPEDIEHFRKHDEMEAEEEKLHAQEQLSIVEANIPQKFRRVGH
ncbi:putative secretory pathway protein Ssp120 [Phyllosticta citrichinensis]|uniref:Secretory pathway protein Ssp120 n=1 Tax=Phyllosticta citrichinensis TaxID=1130410 RepID=A0ABR1XPH3_9PEZI